MLLHKIKYIKEYFYKILCLVAVLLFLLTTNSVVNAAVSSSTDKFTVVIDPGHGGRDPGAVGSFSYEKDIVLAVALKLRDIIQESDENINVILTRETDTFVELFKRAEIANRNNADLFVSLHTNASANRQANGTETFVMGLHRSTSNLEVAKLENAVILKEEDYEDRYGGFDPNDPESHIIFSLFQNAHLEQSLFLAQLVQNNFEANLQLSNRGVKQAGFLVLWKTTMPSVLVEVGFISNTRDEQYINTAEAQERAAKSIYKGIAQYKRYYQADEIDLTEEELEDIFAEEVSEELIEKHEEIKELPKKEKSAEVKEVEIKKDDVVEKEELPDTIEAKEKTEVVKEKPDIEKTVAEALKTKEEAKEIIETVTETAEHVKKEKEKKDSVEPADDKIVFRVQISTSTQKIETAPENFNNHKNVDYYLLDGIYRYTIGHETEFGKINQLRTQLRKDFPDCFVVAFKNGERIPLNEALKKQR